MVVGQYPLGIDETNMTRFNIWRGDHGYQEIDFWDGHIFRFFFESSLDYYNFTYEATNTYAYISFNGKESNQPS